MQLIYALKILIPVSGIILYIPLIYLLLRYRSKYSQAFYTLVLFVSFNDFYCLCRFTFEAVISLIEFVPDGTIYYISNLLAAFSYYMCMFLNLMIAWNRFSAVFFYTYENFLFGTKMIIVYYVTAILISSSMVVLMFYGGLWFNLEWAQDENQNNQLLIEIIGLAWNYSMHSVIIILYIAAFIKYYQIGKHSQISQQNKANRRFLYQAMITAIPCIIYINATEFALPLVIQEVSKEFCMALNPFVYLWFNHNLRNDLLKLIRIKKSHETNFVNPFVKY